MSLRPGDIFDLQFPTRPELGTVRVRILGGDQEPPRTLCGRQTVFIQVLSGQIPVGNPERTIGPGEVTALPVFMFQPGATP